MKRMKKILALLLAAVMVMGMCMTAFAEDGDDSTTGNTEGTEGTGNTGNTTEPEKPAFSKPTADDKSKASVVNINQAGVTVTAYQVVKANYNDKGFTGYSWVEGTDYNGKRELFVETTTDQGTTRTLNIDEDAIVYLAGKAKEKDSEGKGILGDGVPMTQVGETTTYSAELAAGSYVVLVTGSNDIIYNPMLVGVYYTTTGSGDSNSLVTEELDATTAWDLLAQDGFVKSSEPGIEKKIVGSGSNNDHGDDVAIGDTVSFRIDTKMPSYSDQYTDPKFNVSDEISKGLTYVADTLKIYVKTVVDGKENLTPMANSAWSFATDKEFSAGTREFKVVFATDYIKANQGTDIVITYQATLNDKAGINFDPNTNKATLEYSNNPDPNEELKTKDDTTYHYTFGIDAKLYGQGSEEWNKFTEELLKTGETVKVDLGNGTIVEQPKLLPGAEFTLTRADGKTYTTVSDEKGYLSFTGLDAGTYTLQETKAPEGYSLNNAEIPVEIEALYNEDGTLQSYSIKVDGKKTSTYTATYDATTKKVTNIDCTPEHENDWSDVSDTHEIKNTKLAQLPSTGGIGTTIFTIGGCAIMIIAAGLFFATRRKTDK